MSAFLRIPNKTQKYWGNAIRRSENHSLSIRRRKEQSYGPQGPQGPGPLPEFNQMAHKWTKTYMHT